MHKVERRMVKTNALFVQDWPNLRWGQFNNIGLDSIMLHKLRYNSMYSHVYFEFKGNLDKSKLLITEEAGDKLSIIQTPIQIDELSGKHMPFDDRIHGSSIGLVLNLDPHCAIYC